MPGSVVSVRAGTALLRLRLVPLDRHQHGDLATVPRDAQVLAVVLHLGDVLRQARLQLTRSHGVTQRFGHAASVQPRGRYDHIVWLLRLPF